VSTSQPPEVLFVCVHNAGRSQIAAGLLKLRAGSKFSVRSAGSAPADTLNPSVIQAMAELGVDLTDEAPQQLTDDAVRSADVVITMGCGDACPVYPGKRYEGRMTAQVRSSSLRGSPTHVGHSRLCTPWTGPGVSLLPGLPLVVTRGDRCPPPSPCAELPGPGRERVRDPLLLPVG
jgi:arsenate reductase (thioredoxin)